MKKKKILLLFFMIIFLFSVVGGVFFLKNVFKKKDILDELINIDKLDEEFMNQYYENMNKLLDSENRENVLIIVSKEKPEEVYGAKKVIEAPNHTYLLEYTSYEDRTDAKRKFEKDESIYSVSENREYTFSGDVEELQPSTVNSNGFNSWGIEKSGLDHAIEYINENGGDDVTAAIIDTGCDMDLFNASFEGRIETVYNLYNTGTYGNDVMFDHVGHGTHIAGTIAEGTPENVKIIPIKVSDSRSLDTLSILYAIYYVIDGHKADVINMSFGGSMPANPQADAEYIAIESARRDNIISVAAAGNSGTDEAESPSGYDNTISIAAVDSDLNKASFSVYHETVSFAAPGVNILSINGVMSGTSMATPHAVCAVAFLKSIQPDLTFEMTIEALKQNVIDLGAKGKDVFFGYGFIDLSNFTLCEGDSMDSCTSLIVGGTFTPTTIEVTDVELTPYNYGSITNVLPTEIKLLDNRNRYKNVRLDQLDDLTITGYDPYASGEQTVTITYLDISATFKVTNPNNYEMGWKYELIRDENNPEVFTDDYVIVGYYDNNLELEKLYFPNTIDNHKVVSIMYMDMDMPFVFGNSEDAKHYREVYLPRNFRTIGSATFKKLTNLYMIKSYADEIEVYSSAFDGLQFLTTVDANVLFTEYSGGAFSYNLSLRDIRLSQNNTIIPMSAFYNCTSLSSIELPQGTTEIMDYAFAYSGIRSITFPSGLQRIGESAFLDTAIDNVLIPSSVTYIGESAFSGYNFNSVSVSNYNYTYDSRENCNAIIEKSTDSLIVGSNRATVPSSVKSIADHAFMRSYIMEIELPSGLETIGDAAFSNAYYLEKVTIPSSVTSISEDSFDNSGYYTPFGSTFYLYSDSTAHNYVLNHRRTYVLLDQTPNPPVIEDANYYGVVVYRPYDTFDLTKYRAELKFEDIDDWETITTFRNPVYEDGRDSFRYGDSYGWLYYDSSYGYHNLELTVPVEIRKRTPEYTVPTDIYANVNTTLSDVELPAGFVWENGDVELTTLGDYVYDAMYIPEDTDSYEVVEDIAITVHVIEKELIKPTITIADKEYDGTLNLPVSSITVTGISEGDYTIVSAALVSANVGVQNASVTLRLTDDKYESYVFANGQQEKTFTVGMTVLPQIVPMPTMADQTYVYTGEEQTALINDFDSETMTIEGNVQTNAGSYPVIISLKDNYAWENVNDRSVTYTFTIAKANIQYTSNNTSYSYDDSEHGIELTPVSQNVVIKYMDTNGDYTLDDMPMYVDPGVYTIRYKLTIDDNYNPAYGENTVTIIANGIINKTRDFETIYDGQDHTIELRLSVTEYTIHYSVNNTNYDLDELPVFRDVGEYTIYYQVDCDEFDSITASNKVKIYGIQEFDSSIQVKNNILVVTDNSYSNLINKITTYSTSTEFTHYNKYGLVTSNNTLKTGESITVNINNAQTFTYQIALLGDVDGNGEIGIIDYIRIMKHIMNDTTLSGVNKEAADMNKNGSIDIIDYIRIMRIIMEES